MTNKRILVIDDDACARETIQLCLEIVGGWEVLVAASGFEGLTAAETEKPDAIVLDLMMPVLDGKETFIRLQANLATQTIPTIFLTAEARESKLQELHDLGAKGVLNKPFEPRDLVNNICVLLNW